MKASKPSIIFVKGVGECYLLPVDFIEAVLCKIYSNNGGFKNDKNSSVKQANEIAKSIRKRNFPLEGNSYKALITPVELGILQKLFDDSNLPI